MRHSFFASPLRRVPFGDQFDLLVRVPLRELMHDRRRSRAGLEVPHLADDLVLVHSGEAFNDPLAHAAGAVATGAGSRKIARGIGIASLRAGGLRAHRGDGSDGDQDGLGSHDAVALR